jgi:hypothetical protein
VIESIRIHYRKDFAEFGKRELPATLRKANEAMGIRWHQKMLPLHFGADAFTRYHYQPRTNKYERRKFRLYGHRKPLVFTGTLEQTFTRSAKIQPTPDKVTIRMSGPHWLKGYLSFRGRTGTGPDKEKEIKQFLVSERKELGRIQKDYIAKRLNELRSSRTVTA